MATARPLPQTGEVFLDARGGDRALRVSWHTESGLVVLSLWHGNVCSGSFRLAVDEGPDLIDMLRDGLDRAYDVALSRGVVLPGGEPPLHFVGVDGLVAAGEPSHLRVAQGGEVVLLHGRGQRLEPNALPGERRLVAEDGCIDRRCTDRA